jgi:Uncharacterized protein conserved in bacteria (DUF2255)
MKTWSKDELRKITESDDLHIAPLREDGITYGTPTWIWSVAVDDSLYVRAYYGQSSRWYQAAMRQRAGRITAAGMIRTSAEVVSERGVASPEFARGHAGLAPKEFYKVCRFIESELVCNDRHRLIRVYQEPLRF